MSDLGMPRGWNLSVYVSKFGSSFQMFPLHVAGLCLRMSTVYAWSTAFLMSSNQKHDPRSQAWSSQGSDRAGVSAQPWEKPKKYMMSVDVSDVVSSKG